MGGKPTEGFNAAGAREEHLPSEDGPQDHAVGVVGPEVGVLDRVGL